MISIEEAWAILKKHGIKSEKELQRELKNNPLEIGMFTKPYPKTEDARKKV